MSHLSKNEPLKYFYIKNLDPFLASAPKNAIILIDMILGLEKTGAPRPFDRKAKALLGKWHSRVFLAPPIKALQATTYKEACQYAYASTGKKISIQCYNLFPKIRALQNLNDSRLIEYHPEIAFMQMNQGNVVTDSKKSAPGIDKRIQLIAQRIPNYRELIATHLKQKYAMDDLLDSTALALIAQSGEYRCFYQSLNEPLHEV